MSRVTNVILKTACDDSGIKKLNEIFRAGVPFVSCDDESLKPQSWYAGTKALEIDIYPGAFNHLDLNELVSAVCSVQWDDPEELQLFAQLEDKTKLAEIPLPLKK